MQLDLNMNLASGFKSLTQKVRVITEEWVRNEVYCPNCESNLIPFETNNPVGDFYCEKCNENFELKSKKYNYSYKITDGVYSKIKEKLINDELPNFFFLSYDDKNIVNNFFVVPETFFSLSVFEKRKPLSFETRRAEWIGCNILVGEIPRIINILKIR